MAAHARRSSVLPAGPDRRRSSYGGGGGGHGGAYSDDGDGAASGYGSEYDVGEASLGAPFFGYSRTTA